MLRVLIADDEERICQLIFALGEWERRGLEVVGTAANGPDALEMVRTFSPDILITDIRMPGYDGLRLLMEAHRLVPDLEAIIISGYAQFDYAQTAIRFGVGEYLLKPINREALNRSLSNMAERCRDRKRKDTDIESLRKRTDDDVQLLRSKLIADLLAGTFAAADAGEVERVYRFTAGSDALQLLLLKLDYDIDRFSEASLSILRDKVRGVMEPVLASYCTETLVDLSGARMVCLMNYRARSKRCCARGCATASTGWWRRRGFSGPSIFRWPSASRARRLGSLPPRCLRRSTCFRNGSSRARAACWRAKRAGPACWIWILWRSTPRPHPTPST
jgi:two-component system response regulator YesN